jgi:hypothetical protein
MSDPVMNSVKRLMIDPTNPTTEARRLAALFRRKFLVEAAASPEQALEDRGVRQMFQGSWTLLDALNDAYGFLSSHYRNEYVYKNELIEFAGSHFQDDAVPISELNVSWFQGRVDFVVASHDFVTAFELKTSLDSLARVEKQARLDMQIFGRLYIVCDPSWTLRVCDKVPAGIGVLEFHEDGSFVLQQDARDNRDAVDCDATFRCLRQAEYQAVVSRHFGSLPKSLTNIQREHYCRMAFQNLSAVECHDALKDALRKRFEGNRDLWIKEVPPALRQLWCSMKAADRDRLFEESFLQRML